MLLRVAALALFAFLLLAVQGPGTAMERFFVGRTEGQGAVQMMLRGRHVVRDRAQGRIDRSGALILEQVVEEEGRPARRRTWRLVRSGANGIAGMISDARGPVAGEIRGNVVTLRYRLVEGPPVEQTITFQPGGRTARNLMAFRRFGLRVATVESVIRRVD